MARGRHGLVVATTVDRGDVRRSHRQWGQWEMWGKAEPDRYLPRLAACTAVLVLLPPLPAFTDPTRSSTRFFSLGDIPGLSLDSL